MPSMKKLAASVMIASVYCTPVWAQESESPIDYLINKLNAAFDDMAAHFSEIPEPKPIQSTWESFTLTPYKTLRIGEDIRLLVDAKQAGKSNGKVKQRGTVLQLLTPDVTAHIDQDTLVITAKRHSDAKYNVQLSTINGVEAIDLHDNATITGHNLQLSKQPLTINSHDRANVTLEGMVNLGALNQSSSGVTTVLWVDAENTKLNVFNGTIKLAGSSKNTVMWAYGDAVVEAPHLRSKNLWLSAAGNNRSYVNPTGYFYAHGVDHALLAHRGAYQAISSVMTGDANLVHRNLD